MTPWKPYGKRLPKLSRAQHYHAMLLGAPLNLRILDWSHQVMNIIGPAGGEVDALRRKHEGSPLSSLEREKVLAAVMNRHLEKLPALGARRKEIEAEFRVILGLPSEPP